MNYVLKVKFNQSLYVQKTLKYAKENGINYSTYKSNGHITAYNFRCTPEQYAVIKEINNK